MKIRHIAALVAGAFVFAGALAGLDALGIRPVFAGEDQKTAKAAPVSSIATPLDAERSLLGVLNRKEKELASREDEIVKKEERLNVIREDIEARIKELRKEHDEIAALVRKIDEINDLRIKRIVKIYESMKPEEAASRVEKLDEEMAVMILASMSERKAAKILSFVDVAKSVRLSQSLRVKK